MAKIQGEGFTAEVQEDGDKLKIEVDLTRNGVPSRSGKSLVLASTRGNLKVGEVTLGLNVYKRRQ